MSGGDFVLSFHFIYKNRIGENFVKFWTDIVLDGEHLEVDNFFPDALYWVNIKRLRLIQSEEVLLNKDPFIPPH